MVTARRPAHEAIAALRETFGLDVDDRPFHPGRVQPELGERAGRRHPTGRSISSSSTRKTARKTTSPSTTGRTCSIDAGLPVEMPVAASSTPGAQMVLYRWHREPRMADVCADLERAHGAAACLGPGLLGARRAMDARIGMCPLETPGRPGGHLGASLHPPALLPPSRRQRRASSPALATSVTTKPTRHLPYVAGKRWRVNGVEYRSSLAQVAAEAAELLAPMAAGRIAGGDGARR